MTSSGRAGTNVGAHDRGVLRVRRPLRADGHAHARRGAQHARREQRRQAEEAHRPMRLQHRAQQARDVGVDLTERPLFGIVGQRRDRPLATRHDQRVDRVHAETGERKHLSAGDARRLDARVARTTRAGAGQVIDDARLIGVGRQEHRLRARALDHQQRQHRLGDVAPVEAPATRQQNAHPLRHARRTTTATAEMPRRRSPPARGAPGSSSAGGCGCSRAGGTAAPPRGTGAAR